MRATINGKKNQVVTSPWAGSTSSMSQYLPDILDKLTLVDDAFIQGRINVNQAPTKC